jgi:membrane-associated phospholipid phosphatase
MRDTSEAAPIGLGPERARGGERLRAAWLWALLAACLLVAFLLDGRVMAAIRPLHDSSVAQFIQRFVRPLGTGHVQAGILILLLTLGAWRGHHTAKAAGRWGLLALLFCGVTVNVLKILIHRPRPWVEPPGLASWWDGTRLAIGESGLRSFPSAESATTFAIVMVIGFFLPRTRAALLVVAALVAAGRVIVGAHFPSDVIAGAMLGTAVGQCVVRRAARRGQVTS